MGHAHRGQRLWYPRYHACPRQSQAQSQTLGDSQVLCFFSFLDRTLHFSATPVARIPSICQQCRVSWILNIKQNDSFILFFFYSRSRHSSPGFITTRLSYLSAAMPSRPWTALSRRGRCYGPAGATHTHRNPRHSPSPRFFMVQGQAGTSNNIEIGVDFKDDFLDHLKPLLRAEEKNIQDTRSTRLLSRFSYHGRNSESQETLVDTLFTTRKDLNQRKPSARAIL